MLSDFVFLRKEQADTGSKQVGYLLSHPHATASLAFHVPMTCSWSLAWLPWRRYSKQIVSHRLVLSHASAEDQQRCEQHLAQALGGVRSLGDMPGVVRAAISRFHQVPCRSKTSAVWQEPGCHQKIVQTWKIWRQLSAPAGDSMHAIVRRWSLFTSLMRARREQHRHSRRRRRQRLQDLFDRAKQAASRGDRRELHKLVRLLSPRSPRKPLRLRHADGRLMDLDSEVDTIQRRLCQQFASTPATISVLPQTLLSLPFDCNDVVEALKALPNHKAVPSGYVPTELWKRYAKPIGNKVWELLSSSWLENQVAVPSCWSASWLHLIPKPHKNQDRLSGWRPISLQDPCGKAILTMITSAAKRQCTQSLVRQPQFAYLSGRSTGDAIRRVAVHVARSLHQYSLARHTLYDMRAGIVHIPLGGGIQVFLDVENAFDAVPRDLLRRALDRQPVDPELIHLFMSWYSHTTYFYHHHDRTVSVQATTGIRQGCVAAPLLWDCHTSNVMVELQKVLGEQWVSDVLTLFADDFHLQWLITQERDFDEACDQLSLFLVILDKMQVRVCPEKSSIMLLLGGRAARRVVSKRISRRGDRRIFRIRSAKHAKLYGQICFPIVRTQKYLGVMVSYRHMQSSTLSFRIRQSWATFNKLRKWWQPTSLPLMRRMELWKVIVWPTLCYGIAEVGLSKVCEGRLHSTVMKQLRVIACSPLHVTRETNEALLKRVGWTYPVDAILLQAAQQLWQRFTRLDHLTAGDILVHDWQQVRSMLALGSKPHPQTLRRWLVRVCLWVRQMKSNSTELLLPLPRLLASCDWDQLLANLGISIDTVEINAPSQPVHLTPSEHWREDCQRAFPHRMAYRQHRLQEHDEKLATGPKYVPSRDMLDGMPTCKHCGWVFLRRQGLQFHIEKNACSAIPSGSAVLQNDAKIYDIKLKQMLADNLWQYHPLSDETLRVLCSHCALCHQWAPRQSSLLYHLNKAHGRELVNWSRKWALDERSCGVLHRALRLGIRALGC